MSSPIRGKEQPFQLAARSCAASPSEGSRWLEELGVYIFQIALRIPEHHGRLRPLGERQIIIIIINVRTKKCGGVVGRKRNTYISVLSSDSGITTSVIWSIHASARTSLTVLCCVGLLSGTAGVKRRMEQFSNPPLITTVGGNTQPFQLLTEAGEMFHFLFHFSLVWLREPSRSCCNAMSHVRSPLC